MPDEQTPDEPFDWDDEDDDVSLTFDDYGNDETFWLLDEKLSGYGRIGMIIGAAYQEDGEAAISQALAAIEHIMRWRIEIMCDGNAVDDYLLKNYNIFDDTAWWYYVNSDLYQELTLDTVRNAAFSVNIFAKEMLNQPLTAREKLKKRLHKIMRKIG